MANQVVHVVASIVDDDQNVLARYERRWECGLGNGYSNNALLLELWERLDAQVATALEPGPCSVEQLREHLIMARGALESVRSEVQRMAASVVAATQTQDGAYVLLP